MSQQQAMPRERYVAALVIAAIAIVIGVYAAIQFAVPRPAKSDPVAATAANARGVGFMEQFNYPEATKEFEKAAELAPDWLPARINLGMALYNAAGEADDPILLRSMEVFNNVLKVEPKNLYAHFNLGVIKKYQGNLSEAAKHFRIVTELDPTDDRAWLYLGQSDPEMATSAEAKSYFEKALALNPYLNPARYIIANHVLTTQEEQIKLHNLNDQFARANWEDEARPDRHSEQGRYATTIGSGLTKPADIGPLPIFEQESKLTISQPVVWAKLSVDDMSPENRLRALVRKRFGGSIVLFDFNHDGKPDVLLLSAVVRDGKVCDLLLRNEGSSFTDVSVEYGLTGSGSIAAAVGDYDNDGWPDLALSSPSGIRLLRNQEGKKFEDRSAAAGFDKQVGVHLSLCWLDIDQDGDIDLIAGRYANSIESAIAALTAKNFNEKEGGVTVLQNIGTAPPSRVDEPTPPLSTAFKLFTADVFQKPVQVVGLIACDIDGDKDVDLVVLTEGKAPFVIVNDRLMRFHEGSPFAADAKDITGGFILDGNGDEQSDFFFTTTVKPKILVSKQYLPSTDFANRFAPGTTDSLQLLSARRCDLDADGRADVIGLTADRKAVFLQGDGTGKWAMRASAFGPAVEKLKGLNGIATADWNGDGEPDLITWSDEGISVFHGRGNGNRLVRLSFTGKRDSNNAGSGQKNLRTNADGIATKFQTLTGPLISNGELTTLSSGPAQSLLPFEIGIGRAERLDAIRIRWPDCVVQAELGLAAGVPNVITELNRKPTSCPVLMTWDGTKWVYVTDFLGGGALGESGPDGSVRPSRPEESVKIESHQLGLKNGKYVLRIAEPMDEMMYLDHVSLAVVDHPPTSVVFPDERFAVADPQPTQSLLQFNKRIFPARAVDHRGIDQTQTVLARDSKTVDGFAKRSWMGFAEEHWIELTFSDDFKSLPADQPLFMILAGWTDYPYPESIIAAAQAGIEMRPPVLERLVGDNKWETLGELGFPAGLPKVMTVPIGQWLKTDRTSKLRIRTNLQIYWDQISIGTAEQAKHVYDLKPHSASLSHPGFVQEIMTDGKPPQAYDPNRFETVAVTTWTGKRTKLGDVTDLLAKSDERFVLCGPGDEVMVSFDPLQLPPVPAGWTRSFVLRTHGYCKDTAPTTITGGEIEPLPYRAMKEYPPKSPNPNGTIDDAKKWHTRH